MIYSGRGRLPAPSNYPVRPAPRGMFLCSPNLTIREGICVNAESGRTSRRGFLNLLLGGALLGWLGSLIYPLFRYLVPPQIPEAKLTTL